MRLQTPARLPRIRLKTPYRVVTEDAPDKGYNIIRPLMFLKGGVLMNPNTQFSVKHFLGVPLVYIQRFRLLGFIVLGLWKRHTDTHTDTQTHTHLFV